MKTTTEPVTDIAVEIECLQREIDLKTHVLDQYEKEALITLAELEKVTRDAGELSMMIFRLCYALRSLEATDRIHKVRAQAEDLVTRKGYHNILREEGGAQKQQPPSFEEWYASPIGQSMINRPVAQQVYDSLVP